jgi:uncharacterized protein (TIGR03435 family)
MAGLVALAVCAAFAQNATPSPAFEVASVKPFTGDPRTQTARSWGDVTPRVALEHINLRGVLLRVYNLQSDQLTGPAWLDSEFFDIFATVPAGAPKEQVPLMFQALLAERFKLKFHRETQVAQVYALVVGEGGTKLKDPLPEDADLGPNKITGTGEKTVMSGTGSGKFGKFKLTAANGGLHYEFAGMTMEALAEFLSQGQVDLPVVDMTKLKGSYQVPLDVSASDMPGSRAPADQGNAGQAVPTASDPRGNSVRESLQKLGLRLERRKLPTEKFVIDHIERAPTEN